MSWLHHVPPAGRLVFLMLKEIALDHLHPHPLNAHTVTKRERTGIANNIRRTGRYPLVVVRELDEQSEYWPEEPGQYQILDGHVRHDIFEELVDEGREEFSVVRCDDWSPITDDEALILLATLNSWGDNVPRKRAELLHAISQFTAPADAASILPETARQIEDAKKLLRRPVTDIKRLIEQAEQPDLVTMSFVIGGSQKAALARFTAAAQLFAVFYGAELTETKIHDGADRARVAVLTFQVQNAAKTIVDEALKRAGVAVSPRSRNKRGQALEELCRAYLQVAIEDDSHVPLVEVEKARTKAAAPKKKRKKPAAAEA